MVAGAKHHPNCMRPLFAPSFLDSTIISSLQQMMIPLLSGGLRLRIKKEIQGLSPRELIYRFDTSCGLWLTQKVVAWPWRVSNHGASMQKLKTTNHCSRGSGTTFFLANPFGAMGLWQILDTRSQLPFFFLGRVMPWENYAGPHNPLYGRIKGFCAVGQEATRP